MEMIAKPRSMCAVSHCGLRLFVSTGMNRNSYIGEKNMALSDPRQYWDRVAKKMGLFWSEPYKNVLNSSKAPFYSWFDDGMTNMSYNCLDLHVKAGKGNDLALIYDSPVAGIQKSLTYDELLDQVKRFSKVLRNINVDQGDRVIIYMPNSTEAVVAMLACARIGAIHSVVFGGFAAHELATRIRDCRPKAIIAASASLEGNNKIINYYDLVEEALKIAEDNNTPMAERVQHLIIQQIHQLPIKLKPGRDLDMLQEISNTTLNQNDGKCTFVKSSHPLYILYTSGTTGKPKGVLRDTGGYMVALKNSMTSIFGSQDKDVFWAASDVGWVVGHSYSVYGPLLRGITTIIYHGKPVGTPDEAQYWRLINKYKVNTMFTAPTAIRAIKKIDDLGISTKPYDLSSLRALFLAGERADLDTIRWCQKALNQTPVYDHWWQTESGWPITSVMAGLESKDALIKVGSSHKAVPGYNLKLMVNGSLVEKGQGNIVIQPPLPPGFMLGLYNANERYLESYFTKYPGLYDTGDSGIIDDDSYVFVMSRTDDVINVAGHRISTGAIEEVLMQHEDVAEAAVVGIKDKLKGQIPIGLCVLNSHATIDPVKLEKDLVLEVRNRIGAFTCLQKVFVIEKLPKTRSGKILRSTIRSIANHEAFKVPSTIEDVSVIPMIENIIKQYES